MATRMRNDVDSFGVIARISARGLGATPGGAVPYVGVVGKNPGYAPVPKAAMHPMNQPVPAARPSLFPTIPEQTRAPVKVPVSALRPISAPAARPALANIGPQLVPKEPLPLPSPPLPSPARPAPEKVPVAQQAPAPTKYYSKGSKDKSGLVIPRVTAEQYAARQKVPIKTVAPLVSPSPMVPSTPKPGSTPSPVAVKTFSVPRNAPAPTPISKPVQPPPRPAPELTPFFPPQGAPAPQAARRGVCATAGKAASNTGTSSSGGEPTGTKFRSLSRPTRCERNIQGVLTFGDAYAQGVFQGLQRAIIAYAEKKGQHFDLAVNGQLDTATTSATVDILHVIGLPSSVGAMPQTDEDICRDSRAIAEHIAAAAGVALNFTPSEEVGLFTDGADSPVGDATEKKMFSPRNLIIAGLLVSGYLLTRKRN